MSEPLTFSIDTEELPYLFSNEILVFIREYYVAPQPEIFSNVSIGKAGDNPTLSFLGIGPGNAWFIDTKVEIGSQIQVNMTPKGPVPDSALDKLRRDLFTCVQLFEEKVRKSTLYFAWIKGEEILPEEPPSPRKRAYQKIFSSNMLLLYVFLFGVNIVLFLFLGIYSVLVILGIQLMTAILADQIFFRMSK
ncbi:MAG TPA: hypothetical protein VJ574_06355 [Candidatus Bathyarchaeia archaeon]|nr:hypothetical protein [Candidatus Bathyarchaeia archaeon]